VAKAGIEADLSFRVGGTVTEVNVDLGDSVRKGEVLVRLDAVDYELQVEEAEAGLAQAGAALRKSEADFDRTRALYENNNASKSELDAARAAAESARSQVDAATKRLELTQQQLAYTVLRAPADGAIAFKDVEINENVQAGDPVFMMTAGSLAEIEFAVPEIMIADVKVGLPVTVTLDALRGREFPAEIIEVGVAVTGSSATFEATARLLEEVPEVMSGMAAEVICRFQGTGSPGGLVVPWVAVGEDREGRFVFVLEPESEGVGTVHRRAVTIGAIGQSIEILDGIEEGDFVVTAGTRRLTDGMRVKLEGEAGGGA
jgi:RND family efflux transporter MFP subunit